VVSSGVLFLFDRYDHPALPAYIVAGVIVGYFFPAEEMLSFAEIGLSFLVFVFGVKMNPEKFSVVAEDSLNTTLIQMISIGALGAVLAYLLGFAGFEALVFVLVAVLSSTVVGLDLLEEEIDLRLAHGRLAESINLNQDVIAIFFLMLMGAASFTADALFQSLLHGSGVLLAAIVFRGFLFERIAALTENSRELMMLVSISVLIGFLSLTEVFQVSLAIGSFAAGIAVSKYPHNMEVLETVGSLKDFFSAIFFVSLGALLTVPTVEVLGLSLLLIGVTSLVKPYVVVAALTQLGQNKRTAYLTGFSIDQVSEFSLIITIQAFLAGLISDTLFQAVIITATASMILSSYTSRHGDRLFRLLSPYDLLTERTRTTSEELEPDKIEGHVIVAGSDIQGERIIEKLKEEEKEFVVIENDPEKISELREKGEKYVYGDVMEDESWTKAGYRDADLIISTIPIPLISEKILELETDADRILRAETVEEARNLLEKGALYVNVPEILSSELLLDHVEGLMENRQYRDELRRENLLEVKRYIQEREG
jgi:CPA2 family monovalent cation:H+ antiporter-2